MKYRGIEYRVVQGTGRHIWKWSVAFDADHSEAGRAATKAEAILEAERAIERALAPKKRPGVFRRLDAGIDGRSCGASIGAIKVAGRMYPFGPKGPGAAVPGPFTFLQERFPVSCLNIALGGA